MSRTIRTQLPILRRAVRLCEDAALAIPERPRGEIPDRFVKAFSVKAARPARAIYLLYRDGLSLEAQSLVRVLFELHVTFLTFVTMLRADTVDACRRMLDSVTLEKVKQQRACDLAYLHLVPGTPSRRDQEATEREVAKRYGSREFAALREHGFSGKSL